MITNIFCNIPRFPYVIRVRQKDFFKQKEVAKEGVEKGGDPENMQPRVWDQKSTWPWDPKRQFMCLYLDSYERQSYRIFFEVQPAECGDDHNEGCRAVFPFTEVYPYESLPIRHGNIVSTLSSEDLRSQSEEEVMQQMGKDRWDNIHELDLVSLWFHPRHPKEDQRQLPEEVLQKGDQYCLEYVRQDVPWDRGRGVVLGTICRMISRVGHFGVETEPTNYLLVQFDNNLHHRTRPTPLCQWPLTFHNEQYERKEPFHE